MPRPKRNNPKRASKSGATTPERAEMDVDLRIIGGKYRAKRLVYEPFIQAGKKVTDGNEAVVTRPMKHRVREAIFNLVGLEAEGKHALDLFAGTGALGLEALSRGAQRATFIERHLPTADVVKQNIETLGVESDCELLITSAFLWSKRDLCGKSDGVSPPPARRGGSLPQEHRLLAKELPWLVFISPPYAFFIDREEEMLDLIGAIIEQAPPGSVVVVEADERFDFSKLPGDQKEHRRDDGWDVREYAPAVVGVWRC